MEDSAVMMKGSVFDGLKFRRVSSPIHNLDPRMKFIYVIVIFVAALLLGSVLPLLALFLLQVPFVVAARVHKQWVRSLRGAMVLAAFIFFTNLVVKWIYANYTFLIIDIEDSFALTLRFIVLVSSFSVFFLTTSPDMLGLALEQSHVPYEFSFAFTTAVRFVPVLAEEAQTIMDAQKARGLELEKGGFMKRIRNYIPILIPLIVSAIRRSLELAEAMESRAWGAVKKRTNLYALSLRRGDYALLAVTIGILVLTIYLYLFVHIPRLSQLF
jgi:energy-coupling factor transport system permease protein